MTGAQCHASLIDLYDVAGQLRGILIALQDQVRHAQGDEADAGQ